MNASKHLLTNCLGDHQGRQTPHPRHPMDIQRSSLEDPPASAWDVEGKTPTQLIHEVPPDLSAKGGNVGYIWV